MPSSFKPEKRKHNWLPQNKNSFKSLKAHINPQNQASIKALTCSKCGDTKHRLGLNCPAKSYQCKSCKTYGHFTRKCFNLNTKKVQADFYLVDTQEVDHSQ